MAFGEYPSSAAAARTRVRRSALTCGLSRITRDTSERETPARLATSSIVVWLTPRPPPVLSEASLGDADNRALQRFGSDP